jgi:hypothetical protein
VSIVSVVLCPQFEQVMVDSKVTVLMGSSIIWILINRKTGFVDSGFNCFPVGLAPVVFNGHLCGIIRGIDFYNAIYTAGSIFDSRLAPGAGHPFNVPGDGLHLAFLHVHDLLVILPWEKGIRVVGESQ